MNIPFITIVFILLLALFCWVAWRVISKALRTKNEAILRAKRDEIEVELKERSLELKDKFIQKKEALKQVQTERENALKNEEKRINNKELQVKGREQILNTKQTELDKRSHALDRLTAEIDEQKKLLATREEELTSIIAEKRAELEKISGLSVEEAKKGIIESIQEEARNQAANLSSSIIEEARLTANAEARKIVINSLQRVATETSIENATTVFHIDNDGVKGRIIGRDGRNIRALEEATGVEFIVDDTPEAIMLSCFDPMRREIARLSLHQLVTDGRIHPARIEQVVASVTKQVEDEMMETGTRTAIDLSIHGMHPQLIRLVGKMKYRSSYGQNLLQHSRETANLCAIMAAELGLSSKQVQLARRAGLLHDIGKVADTDGDPEQPHALLGMSICKKYHEHNDVCNAVGSHHEEIEMTSLIAPLVQVCDAISGARPGVRRESAEAYMKRLNDLEKLALSYPGVDKSFAIQAGRELRVIVGAEKIDDSRTMQLSEEIARRIKEEMVYPGQVKITVIRELRSVAVAR